MIRQSILALLLVPFTLLASSKYDAGVDLLYWKPINCSWDYGLIVPDAQTLSFTLDQNRVTALVISSDYGLGFRLSGDANYACQSIGVTYTYLKTKDLAFDSLSSSNVALAIVGDLRLQGSSFPNIFARARLQTSYESATLAYRHDLCSGLATYGELRWSLLERNANSRGMTLIGTQSDQIIITTIVRRANFQGTGVGGGLIATYPLTCDLSLFGDLGATALIGRQRTPEHGVTYSEEVPSTFSSVRQHYPSRSVVVPHLHTRLGLAFETAAGCFDLAFTATWDLDYYWNALEYSDPGIDISGPATINPRTVRSCHDIGFTGLSLGFTLGF